MLRPLRTTTVAALVVAAALPTAAAGSQDLRMPDTRDAAGRSPSGGSTVNQDLRSPDARDAAERPASPVVHQDLRSPDTRDAANGVQPAQPVIVSVPAEAPVGGFDWGDAGIGAAGGIAILTIFGGLGSLAVQRRRSTGTSLAR
jgi:hypothetical protein